MKKAWTSKLKIRLFRAAVKSILLYGSETWTITETLAKRIDGCYTHMLRMALDVPWYLRITKSEVYESMGGFPKSQNQFVDGG